MLLLFHIYTVVKKRSSPTKVQVSPSKLSSPTKVEASASKDIYVPIVELKLVKALWEKFPQWEKDYKEVMGDVKALTCPRVARMYLNMLPESVKGEHVAEINQLREKSEFTFLIAFCISICMHTIVEKEVFAEHKQKAHIRGASAVPVPVGASAVPVPVPVTSVTNSDEQKDRAKEQDFDKNLAALASIPPFRDPKRFIVLLKELFNTDSEIAQWSKDNKLYTESLRTPQNAHSFLLVLSKKNPEYGPIIGKTSIIVKILDECMSHILCMYV